MKMNTDQMMDQLSLQDHCDRQEEPILKEFIIIKIIL